LHAKVLLLDGTAVIGSGNLSASSESTLVDGCDHDQRFDGLRAAWRRLSSN